MSVPLWVAELVHTFWKDVGATETFPRNLRQSIARALPVTIVMLPRLRVDGVRAWLRENRIFCPCQEADRPLRACLAAVGGYGLIFLDGTDKDDEQRFSLAHEMGHFLRHYWRPRQLACQRLGEQIAEVFDGKRLPTPEERLHALLRNATLGLHLHLLRRGPRCELLDAAVVRAEEEADQVAYELLAPSAEVLRQTGDVPGDNARVKLAEVLRTTYGLPEEQATDYARQLSPPVWEDPLLRRLRS
jgi:hypothetical protein